VYGAFRDFVFELELYFGVKGEFGNGFLVLYLAGTFVSSFLERFLFGHLVEDVGTTITCLGVELLL